MIHESNGVTEEMRNQLGAVDILASRLSEQEYDEKTKIYRYTDRQKTELRLYDTRAGKFRMISGFTGVDFDMSPAVAISHRDRLHYDDDDERISSYGCTILDEPGVSLFTCRNRLVMLEIEEIDPDTDFVKFRYKLADVRANGEWF